MSINKTYFKVTKRSGKKETFDFDELKQSIEKACQKLPKSKKKSEQIFKETQLIIYDGITTQELDEALINTAVQNIKDDPDFDIIATRLLLKNIYKNILGEYTNEKELKQLHRDGFINYIKQGIKNKLLDAKLAKNFDLHKLADKLKIERDALLKYIGLKTILKRYMLHDKNNQVVETPQYFRMRLAMGLSLKEKNPTEWAIKFYEKLSKLELVTGGSVAIGAGTPTPRLSNCFLMEMQDSIDDIGNTIANSMKLLKATGGIGLAVSKLRAEGSAIKSNNTQSSGPIPFLHTIDSTLRAVSRAGKKMGALCFYMENWHLDFDDFLDLKQNAGDEYRRTRTANTAVYFSDEFMQRVIDDADWYLFDPRETNDLTELYGKKFSQRYQEYIQLAENGKLEKFKKIKAREQFRNILVLLQTTSHPWLTWKDAINLRALNNNTGTIHCSNLCTEICLPQNKDNIAVCNLTYLNLTKHLTTDKKKVDWQKLSQSIQQAIRLLDNLVDVNQPPVPQAKKADQENRAVGLGLMGFAETIEYFGWAYEDEKTYKFVDKLFEFISYEAINASAELAQHRGSYKNFAGSEWSRGKVPIDSLKKLNENRITPITVKMVNNKSNLDWDKLRQKVKQGMRNATLMAIAPNANAGLAAGTSPSIDPRFSQMFSRSTLSGKYLEVNETLVKILKAKKLWDKVKDQIMINQGDLSEIKEIPENIKKIYKTSFTTSPYAYIEVAARAQKWIDQAISRNIYLATREIDEMIKIYTTAWQKGLKTTYYLHVKPRHTAEQSTAKVNKGIATGKKGFGLVNKNTDIKLTEDPTEKMVCDGCA